MQTKLRALGLVVVASLLWISPKAAESQRAQVQEKGKSLKVKYIGTASWYGIQHQGRPMANGKPFDRYKLTAASWYFPLGTTLRVVNVKNGGSVVVTVTDRGPNFRLNRLIDLSEAAAERLSYRYDGLTTVFIYPLPQIQTQEARFDVDLFNSALSTTLGDVAATELVKMTATELVAMK